MLEQVLWNLKCCLARCSASPEVLLLRGRQALERKYSSDSHVARWTEVAMHRRTVLIGVFAGIGLVCASTLSTAQNDVDEGDGHGGQFTVTDRDGHTPSAGPPLTERQRKQRRQVETPEQVRKRIDYLESLQRKNSSGD
ncbi:hypothetical protein ACFUV2_28320 [Streptomyces pilosus]|uniref:hypothetical protein n=1 Tax=Streptomyces pilosus TaxID=28893 RepID=UPI0016724BBF|nr:hypothetical protein [Streptomyces pilosus]GGV67096.1 hypothetical protein GCM10010261_59700 [Streptomyces pilosus]